MVSSSSNVCDPEDIGCRRMKAAAFKYARSSARRGNPSLLQGSFRLQYEPRQIEYRRQMSAGAEIEIQARAGFPNARVRDRPEGRET
jgi:hypothetical protein